MKYTKEATQKLVHSYQGGTSVEALAVDLGVPVRSVIAKLSSLGVYQKKVYLDKRGEVPVSKEELIDQVAVLLGVAPDLLDSLEKCNKSVIKLILNGLK